VEGKRPDPLLRVDNLLKAAEEEAVVLAGRSLDVRLIKIIELIALPNIHAARAAIRVARHIHFFPNLHLGDEGSSVKDGDSEKIGDGEPGI